MFENKGKVVLITGGIGGIGLELCKAFLNDDVAGVSLVDLRIPEREKLVNELSDRNPGRVLYVTTDVTDIRQIDEAFKKTINTFGRLDIVINGAGVVNKDTHNIIKINLIAPIDVTNIALEKYLKDGLIINIASIAAFVPVPIPNYAATKAGLLTFGRALNVKLETEKINVKVITVCPGATHTPLLNELNGALSDELLAQYNYQEPKFVGESVAKLTSKAQSGSIWIVEDYDCYEIELPNYVDLKKK